MNKKELELRLVNKNVESIVKRDKTLDVLYRNDEKHVIIVKEFDDIYHDDTDVIWGNYWKHTIDSTPKEVLCELSDLLGEEVETIYNNNINTQGFFDDIHKLALNKGILLYPITQTEHSDVYYYRGALGGYDRCVVGYAYATISEIISEGVKGDVVEKSTKLLDDTLSIYSQWCNGYIYSVSVYDTLEDYLIDGVCGLYDDDNIKYQTNCFIKNFKK